MKDASIESEARLRIPPKTGRREVIRTQLGEEHRMRMFNLRRGKMAGAAVALGRTGVGMTVRT
jgi:hypothetical protein